MAGKKSKYGMMGGKNTKYGMAGGRRPMTEVGKETKTEMYKDYVKRMFGGGNTSEPAMKKKRTKGGMMGGKMTKGKARGGKI